MREACDPLNVPQMRAALAGNAGIMKSIQLYHEIVEIRVFPTYQEWHGADELKSYRKILHDIENYAILSIIWKESKYVQRYAGTIRGLSRTFDKKLNYYSFAKKFAENDVNDLARCNSWVRSVCVAAEAFLLIERVNGELLGTDRLDSLMMYLGCEYHQVMGRLSTVCDPQTATLVSGEE